MTDSELTKPGATTVPCPVCNAPRIAVDRYCERCGHDFEAPSWELLIDADRDHHARFAAGAVTFPDHLESTSIPLELAELLIGRLDGGAARPDLTGAGDDPALSRRHARLVRQDDGSYTIEDLGSTNGTEVNGRQIANGEVVALRDGDRVLLGAWTAMTVRQVAPTAS